MCFEPADFSDWPWRRCLIICSWHLNFNNHTCLTHIQNAIHTRCCQAYIILVWSLAAGRMFGGWWIGKNLEYLWPIKVYPGPRSYKAPSKYKSTELELQASQCTLLILILVTILRYFVLKKCNAALSIMEYFMYVDEVTSFSYYPVLSYYCS